MADLFPIFCTTCRTRLRVRDASFIGQIQACPKCGSMVLIEPPAGWAPPKNEPAPVQPPAVLTKQSPKPASSAAVPSATPSRAPAAVDPSSLKETASDSDFNEVDMVLAGKPAPARAAQGTAVAPPRDTPPQPPPAEAAEEALAAAAPPPSPPASDWTPPGLKRYRLLALLTVGGCMGVALAIGAAFLVASWNDSKQREQLAENVAPAEDSTDASSVDPKPPTERQVPDEVPPEPPEVRDDSAVEKPPQDEPPPRKTDDPLNLVEDPPPASVKPAADDPLKLNDLRKLSNLLQDDAGPMPVEGETVASASDVPPPLEEPEASPSLPRPEPRKVDLKARLADPIVEIQATDQPLDDLLAMISGMTRIPITIDPEALVWSRIAPSAPVHVHLTNTTVSDTVTEALKPFRLEAVEVGDQLLITRSPAIRTIKSPVDDLTGGNEAKQRQLIEMIESLAAPSSWKSAGGEGTITSEGSMLIVANTELAYGQVLHLCERLRVARGLRPRSVFPPELFVLERRSQQAAKNLAVPLTLNFGQPTQLTTILDRLAEETGTHILVDWRAAGEAGWPPDSDATVTLEKTPLGEALTKLLGPMDLTYRVVDARILQVTTFAALEREPEIEIHPVRDLAASAEEAAGLIERLVPALGDQGVLRYDAPSKSLVALLSQPKHEALARLLDEQRPKKKQP